MTPLCPAAPIDLSPRFGQVLSLAFVVVKERTVDPNDAERLSQDLGAVSERPE